MEFLIVCPLAFLAGFVDAIAGGGGLISLPAYLIAGLPVHMAIGTNKLSAGMGTAVATWRFWRKGYIPVREAVFGVLLALAGAWIGARAALLIPDGVFRVIMLVVLPVTGAYVMFGRRMEREETESYASSLRTRALVAAVAFFIGIYDGLYGPGTGTFLMLLLTGLARLPLQKAAGVTKAINLTTNITALTVYLTSGTVLLLLGLTAGLFSICGNYLGARCFSKSGARVVKPVMIFVLVIFFIKTLYELLA
ncbi:sulfite exporter TauE/SafE family protein [Anaerotignum lactatifermentans]|uniref:Probable membrane transporter protein n=1 Tax=Anaerotignum lactatifermentans TaxID=160404 RepID=A0ABS2GAK2_9FIRM|nr:sulfite exporter TauE/SafE family protein [Anaerotignum lactatifermentans]MBM6828629.1 sulfite exporter TauE/SafE family protein [Anaerotignum lactatifermentans]MBM6878499.1 sulfite exporter TauE/SafE family protein [Anaerotignum lactatifermentans]MBM6950211.1 sulfite exporter TauE/SafE family protein [Anaerotignum lactatifermentans]